MTSVQNHRQLLNGNEMICIPAKFPRELWAMDNELIDDCRRFESEDIGSFQPWLKCKQLVLETKGMNTLERKGHFQVVHSAGNGIQVPSV